MLSKIKLKFGVGERMKNVAKISFGTLVGQGISFITLPILTRVYGAEIIGVWTFLNSIALIINSFSDIGLTNAIMLEKDESNMIKLYKVISSTVLIISILVGIVFFIYYKLIPNANGISALFLGFFMIISIFTLQQIQVCYTWLNRKSEYKILMKNPVINNTIFGVIAILIGILGFKLYGYFIGWILGQILTLLHMKRFLPKGIFTLKINDFREIIQCYNKFIKYQLPTNLVGNIKNQIPVLFIKSFFGTEILGYYSITVRLMQIPTTLLASAMGRVFFQTVSDMKRKGKDIGEFIYNSIIKVMKVAIIPIILIFVIGDYVIILFLGNDWAMAGDFLRILALQNFFNFLMSTVQGIAIILDKQRLAMFFCIIQSIAFIIGLSVGKFIFENAYIGIFLMSFAFIICNVVYFCFLFRAMRIDYKKYLLHLSMYIFIMLVSTVVIRGVLCMFGVVKSII